MAIYTPARDWFKAPEGPERTWIALALGWCIIMSIVMPWWHFKGKQNSTGESYRTTPMEFVERVNRTVETQKVGEYQGVPVVEPAPGGDAYMIGKMWAWYPVLKLKAGQTYRLHISSQDLQHGFSLMPLNMNFQVMPGYDHVLTLTPTTAGEYTVICNEFCGAGHHQMTGRILVE